MLGRQPLLGGFSGGTRRRGPEEPGGAHKERKGSREILYRGGNTPEIIFMSGLLI